MTLLVAVPPSLRPSSFVVRRRRPRRVGASPTHPSPAFAHNGYYVVSEAQYTGPEQDTDGAYLITDARDLYWIATNKACRAASFKQTANIVWTSADGVDGTFPGIGTYKNNASSGDDFSGTYDGQGFSIKDIVLKGSSASNNGKYAGLFNQVKGGTVKNLVVDGVTFADEWGYDLTADKKDFAKEIGGAMAIAHLMDGTVKNVTTKGSFGTAEKPLTASAGGVVCRVSGGALIEACTNEASLYGAGAKVAGILILSQNGKDNTTVTIKDCYNSGSINFVNKGRSDTAGGFAGIVAYLGNGKDNQYIQNCVNVGTINASAQTDGAIGSILGSQRTGTVTATGCSAQADFVGVGYKADATKCAGLDFATVDGNVATFVAAPALGGTYKVMAAVATYAFTEAGSITFDTALNTGFMPTTAMPGYEVTKKDNVYTCAAINYTITYNYVDDKEQPLDDVDNENETSFTIEDAITIDGAKITKEGYEFVSATPASIAKGTTENQTIKVVMKKAGGGWDPSSTDTVNTVLGDKAPEALKGVSFGQLSTWAQGNGNLDFANVQKAEDINVEAFLFNVDNNGTGVAAEKAAFKFTAITPGETPEIRTTNLAGDAYNGTVTVKAFEDAACTTEVTDPTGEETELFYQATLEPTPAPVED